MLAKCLTKCKTIELVNNLVFLEVITGWVYYNGIRASILLAYKSFIRRLPFHIQYYILARNNCEKWWDLIKEGYYIRKDVDNEVDTPTQSIPSYPKLLFCPC